jgi:hypothetical protein
VAEAVGEHEPAQIAGRGHALGVEAILQQSAGGVAEIGEDLPAFGVFQPACRALHGPTDGGAVKRAEAQHVSAAWRRPRGRGGGHDQHGREPKAP